MENQKGLVILSSVLGVIFFVIGLVYATHTAGMLPSFLPGHMAGSSSVHVKHSIAAFIVGIACFIFAWFKSGPKPSAT
jgi:hypothetical protein